MTYRELKKYYYGDDSQYKQEYLSRLEDEHTIKLDFYIHGKQAFFQQNFEILSLTIDILKLDREVHELSSELPEIAKRQYSRKCLIDEIVLTNKIEGVHSSRKEIGEALDILEEQSKQKRDKKRRVLSLVNKYLKLMSNEEIALKTCQDIRNIYDEIFLDEIIFEDPSNKPDGKIFRKNATSVYTETEKKIHDGLYPEENIINAMEKALHFLNDSSVRDLYRICLFHYLIGYIHPFYDGNGRLGRFIVSYCISETLEPLLAYRISETIKENISSYYKAFKVCNDPHSLGDLTPFLLMMLNMILKSAQELQDSLADKLNRWGKYERFIELSQDITNEKMFAMYSFLIQAALFSENGISTQELQSNFHTSYNTVKKMLDNIDPALITIQTRGRKKYYQMNLQALDHMLLDQI